MSTRRYLHTVLRGPIAAIICAVLVVNVPAQMPEVTELLDTMEASHAFPPGCSMGASAVSTTSWVGAPESAYAEYVGKYRDEWTASSNAQVYGIEARYETYEGVERWRTVISGADRMRFTFDEGAAVGGAETGMLSVWRGRGEPWAPPVTQYLERNFMAPDLSGRRGPGYHVAEKMEEVDGHSCYFVQIYWNRRYIDLWLDPAFGCLPRRFMMRNDLWRGQDPRSPRNRTASATGLRFTMPPALEGVLGRPNAYEERMERVELDTFGGRPYIVRAHIERSLIFENGMAHVEQIEYSTEVIASAEDFGTAPFLAFAGLVRNGDRVQLYGPESNGTYVNMNWQDGQLVDAPFSLRNMFSTVGQSLSRITTSFSVESMREVDVRIVVGICAVLAVGINGAIMWVSLRRRRATSRVAGETGDGGDVTAAD